MVDDEIIDNDKCLQFLMIFFITVLNLNIRQYEDPSVNLEKMNDSLEKIREKYKNHPSILAVLQQQFEKSFSFRIIPKEESQKEVLSLNDTKTSQKLDISTKIIKMNIEIRGKILYSEFNKAMELSQIRSCMKTADVTQVYKKGSLSVKDNYHPVSILPNLSKVFERSLYKQVSPYFD